MYFFLSSFFSVAMANLKCILGTAVLFTFYSWTQAVALRNSTDESTISDKLEVANTYLDGDTAAGVGDSGAFRRVRRNADPCVNTYCKWDRFTDGNVYVPFEIDSSYSFEATLAIVLSMSTFSQSTCVHFKLRTNEPDYVSIQPGERCWSEVGRQGGGQLLELKFPDCFKLGTIQHELLHALGFRHEHVRSDRDQHVRVLWENIQPSYENNFRKIKTENLGTSYDYNSVMHYERDAASKNGMPTLQALCNLVEFGTASQMTQTDIDRVNRLYCTNTEHDPHQILRELFGWQRKAMQVKPSLFAGYNW